CIRIICVFVACSFAFVIYFVGDFLLYEALLLLSQELIVINQKICRLRPFATPQQSPEKKNGAPHPTGNHPRTRTSLAADFLRTRQDGSSGFGSDRDGHAFGHAPGGSSGSYRTAEI